MKGLPQLQPSFREVFLEWGYCSVGGGSGPRPGRPYTWYFSRGESSSMCGVWCRAKSLFYWGHVKVALTPPTSSHPHHIPRGPSCLLSCQPPSGRDPDSAKGILGAGGASPLRILAQPWTYSEALRASAVQ